ncbi:MAG: peptidase domain-containing ABC transporter [Acidobacteriia bacterium]|nr:peptidase domain-containing ABC transporter [Terriglobia bacterium]
MERRNMLFSMLRSWLRSRLQRRLPAIFQAEAAECGLACLAMVAAYHGDRTGLPAMRKRFSISLRGTTLAHILRFADQLGMTGRALRIELEDLPYLKTPCILHWDMNHFVVLKAAGRKRIILHDPATGPRKISYTQASRHFTGIALELTPTQQFATRSAARPLRLRDLTGRIIGLKRALGQIFALACALEFFSLLGPLFLQLTLDKVVNAANHDLLTALGIGFMLLVAMQAALGALRSWTTLYFGTSLKLQWHNNLFSHLVRLPVSFFEKRYFGDIMSRFDGAEVIQRTITNNFIEAVLDGIISIFILAVMFFYSRPLALIVTGCVLVYVVLRNVSYAPMRAAMEEQIVCSGRQQSFLIETLRGVRTIKTFGREHNRRSRWMNLLVSTTNAQVTLERLGLMFRSSNSLIFGLQSVAVVWFGARLVLNGAFTAGMLFAFVAYQEQFKARIAVLIDRFFEFRMLSLQVQRLADVVFESPEPVAESLPSGNADEGCVEVRGVFFRYSDTERWLLEDIHLRVERGECVAITAPSGTGKSTLLKLMAGLLEPQSGEVMVGGHSVSTSRAAILGKVGFVLQDDSLFGGTISDNIAFAADVPDLERVRECARLACLHDEILEMPMGYSTLIGDMGCALSGGQQQRLLLARALYQQPSILILDEATSHLDVPTEKRIAGMLASLKITRIFVAHRPDTVAIASRVIALTRQGTIAAAPPRRPEENANAHGPGVPEQPTYAEPIQR